MLLLAMEAGKTIVFSEVVSIDDWTSFYDLFHHLTHYHFISSHEKIGFNVSNKKWYGHNMAIEEFNRIQFFENEFLSF